MSEDDGRGRAVTGPADLWRQWFDTSAKTWSNLFQAGGRESYADPYGLYRQWFTGLEDMRERMLEGPQKKAPGGATGMEGGSPVEKAKPVPAVNPLANAGLQGAQDLWRQWFEAVNETAQRSVGLGTEAARMWPRWIEMFDQIRTNFAAVENVPTDPLQFATQWYNATSGPYSDLVADLIEREEFLEPSSRLLQNYASFYKVFKRNSEEYLRNLQLPVRSDITRVAGLVVALEDKVDNLEESFEDFEDGLERRLGGVEEKLDNAATAEAVTGVEQRIAGLEDKLDDAATAGAVAGVEEHIAGLEEKLDNTATAASVAGLETMETRLGEVEEKLDNTASAGAVAGIEERIAGLEKKLDDAASADAEDRAGSAASLERRLDGVEEKLDAAAEASDGAATASAANLERRLDGVEEKLDQLLAALESAPQNGGAQVSEAAEPALSEAPQEPLQSNGAQAAEPQAESEETEAPASAAARRKAEELGVDLGAVEGTGPGGQITIDDVRRAGGES